jgi:hypothetical protein
VKLRKQAPAKAAIIAATAGLLFAFYALIWADPRIEADGGSTQPAVNYDRFFAPATAPGQAQEPLPPVRIRTRAS